MLSIWAIISSFYKSSLELSSPQRDYPSLFIFIFHSSHVYPAQSKRFSLRTRPIFTVSDYCRRRLRRRLIWPIRRRFSIVFVCFAKILRLNKTLTHRRPTQLLVNRRYCVYLQEHVAIQVQVMRLRVRPGTLVLGAGDDVGLFLFGFVHSNCGHTR